MATFLNELKTALIQRQLEIFNSNQGTTIYLVSIYQPTKSLALLFRWMDEGIIQHIYWTALVPDQTPVEVYNAP